MSDHWEFYPSPMGDHQAFIFYDHGIREEIDDLPHPNALKIRVRFRIAAENGLPTNDEFEQLSALEDLLTARVGERGGVYVGGVSVGGARYFHCFVPFTEDETRPLLREIAAESGYELDFVLKPDPLKETYWEELFPSDDEWRVIQDLKVLQVLGDKGDDPSIPRRIDHWSYFPASAERDAFAEWAAANSFTIEQMMDPEADDDEWGVQVYHDARPELPVITATTQLLLEKARELGGSYDGWETHVVPGPQPDAP
jgi:hypothetical protein